MVCTDSQILLTPDPGPRLHYRGAGADSWRRLRRPQRTAAGLGRIHQHAGPPAVCHGRVDVSLQAHPQHDRLLERGFLGRPRSRHPVATKPRAQRHVRFACADEKRSVHQNLRRQPGLVARVHAGGLFHVAHHPVRRAGGRTGAIPFLAVDRECGG